MFGSKSRTIREQAAVIERLREQLAEARAELATEGSLRRRQTQRLAGADDDVFQLRQQRSNARAAAERANHLIRTHVCPRVPGDADKVAAENGRLRALVAGQQRELLLLQDANEAHYRQLAERAGVTPPPAETSATAPAETTTEAAAEGAA